MDGDTKFVTQSKSENTVAFERHYEFSDEGMIMVSNHSLSVQCFIILYIVNYSF